MKRSAMRKVLLYIGVSLDGYIADRTGSVAFLDGAGAAGEFAYDAFLKRVDTVLMGYRTYRQVVEELSPDVWPYEGLETLLFTHRPVKTRPGVRVVRGAAADVVAEYRRQPGRDLWLCGGGDLISQLWQSGCVDELWLTVAPRVLGGGVPLLPRNGKRRELTLLSAGCCGESLMCRYGVGPAGSATDHRIQGHPENE